MRKSLFFGFGAIIISGLGVFAAMEITLRVIFHESMNFDIEMWKYARAVKRLATDPAIGHEHTPGTRVGMSDRLGVASFTWARSSSGVQAQEGTL